MLGWRRPDGARGSVGGTSESAAVGVGVMYTHSTSLSSLQRHHLPEGGPVPGGVGAGRSPPSGIRGGRVGPSGFRLCDSASGRAPSADSLWMG